MALKNLHNSIERRSVSDAIHRRELESADIRTACSIIDVLFIEINNCVQHDRSKTKLNAFTKGIIGSMLGDRTRNGIKEYITNMYPEDIRNLLDGIQREMNRGR